MKFTVSPAFSSQAPGMLQMQYTSIIAVFRDGWLRISKTNWYIFDGYIGS